MKTRIAFLAISVFFLNACASLSEGECRSGNWYQIGFSDGSSGKASSYIVEHESACTEYGVGADRQAYEKGRYQGLSQNYCTAQKGYQLGSYLNDYNGVCPPELAQPLLNSYADSLHEQHQASQYKLEQYASDIRHLEAVIARTDDIVTADQLKVDLDHLDHEYQSELKRFDKIEYLLRKHQL